MTHMNDAKQIERQAFAKALGERLTQDREKKGVSRETLAERIGCFPGELKAYEVGFRIPSAHRLHQYYEALGLKKIDVVPTDL